MNKLSILSVVMLVLVSASSLALGSGGKVSLNVEETVNKPDPVLLEERVRERWKALIRHDFKKVFSFFSPAYQRLYGLEYYLARTGSSVRWLHFEIVERKIEGNRAEVGVNVRYKLNLDGPSSMVNEDIGVIDKYMQELWIWKENNWWYITPLGKGL